MSITATTVAATVPVAAAATTTTVTIPPGTLGDVILIVVWADDAGAGRTITGPPTWTTLREFGNLKTGTTTATASMGVWGITRSPDTPSSVQLTHPTSTGTQFATLLTIQHDVSSPTITPGPWAGRADPGSGATTTTAVAPSMTMPGPGTLVTLAGERTLAAETAAQIGVTPGTLSALSALSGSFSLVTAYRDTTSGPTQPTTIQYPNAHTNNAAAGHFALSTASRAPTRIQIGSRSAEIMVGHTGQLRHVADMRQTRPGLSVATATAGPVWSAHRGGSRDFPEMSRQAYAGSALLGWPVLEISLTRSSDGVWVGLHDRYLDRVVLGTDTTTLDPMAMTWAEIDALTIRGATAPNRPTQPNGNFCRLDDMLTRYPKHVWMVDPKYSGSMSDITDLLDVLDAHGGPTRNFLKSFGVGQLLLPSQGAARGYRCWGYFYPANLPGLSQSDIDRFDWLGFPWDATQGEWDTLRARAGSRPIWAHICPDRASIATAAARGADGYQCGGVMDIAGLVTI